MWPQPSVGYSLASDPLNNTNRDAFAILIKGLEGKPLGIQFIPTDGSEKRFALGSKAKAAFFRIPGSGPLIIVEGVLDALTVVQVLPGADVAAILGASFTEKLSSLRDSIDLPILFLDRDDAGKSATSKATKILNGRCRAVDWQLAPDDCKDPNDLLRSGHAETIKEMVDSALPANGSDKVKQNKNLRQ